MGGYVCMWFTGIEEEAKSTQEKRKQNWMSSNRHCEYYMNDNNTIEIKSVEILYRFELTFYTRFSFFPFFSCCCCCCLLILNRLAGTQLYTCYKIWKIMVFFFFLPFRSCLVITRFALKTKFICIYLLYTVNSINFFLFVPLSLYFYPPLSFFQLLRVWVCCMYFLHSP